MAKKRASGGNPDDVVTVKKYANRRLYDTEKSTYITLDDLAAMIRAGREFEVVDAKTGDDLTRSVLGQIIMEEESRGGPTMLPAGFLRQLIGLYGDSMQSVVPGYLDASMAMFRKNREQFRTTVGAALSGTPLADLSRRNIEMFEAATRSFGVTAEQADDVNDGKDAEIARLKAELAALKRKSD